MSRGNIKMRIDTVYNCLKTHSNGKGLTASELAESIGLSRANVSSELNKLVSQGKAVKTKGKPVYYSYLTPEITSQHVDDHLLDSFVAENPSLSSAVAQAKAAILYPPRGMNLLLLGETGVGKSMFAEMLHAYAISTQKIDKNAPFVIFNCADYSNNPQLLIAQLFGSRRGAYTGADEEHIGLLEKARQGILFLDEVHRLPPEGQEMFFTFIDKGIYRRLGETSSERTASVRIFAATTESPRSALLNTFTRRFPVSITLPALRDRPLKERFSLIKRFFSQEARQLRNQIKVSANTLRALLSYDCTNNIGQLKSDIRFSCANAWMQYCSGKTPQIEVYSRMLPANISEALYAHPEHRKVWGDVIGISKKSITFSAENLLELKEDNYTKNIYDMLNLRMAVLKSLDLDENELRKEIENDITEYIHMQVNDGYTNYNSRKLFCVVPKKILHLTEELIRYAEINLQRPLSSRLYYGLAKHIENAIERVNSNKCIIHPQLNHIRKSRSDIFNLALNWLHIIERVMEITFPVDEAGFLAMFLVFSEQEMDAQNNNVQVLVVAHGENTASALVDTANELLGVNYAVAFNAPLEQKPQQILERIINYIREENKNCDIMMLVDMGSLTTFAANIEQQCSIKVASLQLISTLHIIEAIQSAMNGNPLQIVYQDVQKVNQLMTLAVNNKNPSPFTFRQNMVSHKLAIITLCTTGEGSARLTQNLLTRSLSYRKNLIEIITLNIDDESDITRDIAHIATDYMIIAIVSPFEFDSHIPVFGLADILHHNGISTMQELIDTEVTYSLVTGTLEQLLTNLPVENLVSEIKKFNKNIIASLGVSQSTNLLIGLIMHIACMVERHKNGESAHYFEHKEKHLSQYHWDMQVIRKEIVLIEQAFDVKLDENELCTIHRYYRQ
ncbi:sigma-54-dependent transcriptional regulator [Erwinia psidii]|nr:sigma-54-dependent transcriptional regulator [Erwinia psidii]